MAFKINNNQIPVDKYQEGHICVAFIFFKGTVNVKPLAAKLRQVLREIQFVCQIRPGLRMKSSSGRCGIGREHSIIIRTIRSF